MNFEDSLPLRAFIFITVCYSYTKLLFWNNRYSLKDFNFSGFNFPQNKSLYIKTPILLGIYVEYADFISLGIFNSEIFILLRRVQSVILGKTKNDKVLQKSSSSLEMIATS